MSKKNVQVIENAKIKDVKRGDHITWMWSYETDGATLLDGRAGVAWYTDNHGDWYNEQGMLLTEGDGKRITLTIRRPITKES